MAMKTCKDCGAHVSKSAKSCPQCGKKLKHTGLRVLLGLILVVIGLSAILANSPDSKKDDKEYISYDEFNQISEGMTYDEVVSIIGFEGTLSTESTFMDQTMQIYGWYGEDNISNATISFTNGLVSAKSQIGLNNQR